ncbi:MAG: glycoside hydrolase family 172 protein [Armatimonadota bacterium]
MHFNGLGMDMGTLSLLSDAKTRSLSAENPTGEVGKGGMATEGTGAKAARDLGQGWKINPCIEIEAGQTVTIADIHDSGAIQQMWFTPSGHWRYTILRIYWDGQEHPSVEVPIGDFFACGWQRFAQVTSLPVCVNPGSAFNCYWEMPFRKSCRITVENIANEKMTLFYQINYTLTEVPEYAGYFHAQFRRENPTEYKRDFTILDGVKGKGHFVGTYMAWQVNNCGWWGEGEIKFFMDGDGEFPTICGTGTEDYFCGSYGFYVDSKYREFTTPYAGMPQVIRPDAESNSQTRLGLYRWHISDPIRFDSDLRVTMQALGWRCEGRFLPLRDDIASVAFWYQTLPTAPFPAFPIKDELEVI